MDARILSLLAVLLIVGCEGPTGPTGPQGIQGLQGQPGVVNFFDGVTQLDSQGDGSILLPAAAGTVDQPPIINRYMALTQSSDTWLIVGTDLSGPSCGITDSGGRVVVRMIAGGVLWWFKATAAW